VTSSEDLDQLEKLVNPISNLPLLTQYDHEDDADQMSGQSNDEPGSQDASSMGSQTENKKKSETSAVSRSLKTLVIVSKKKNGPLVNKTIEEIESNISNRIKVLEKKMTEVEKDKDKALADVETWRARQMEAPNYDEVMKRREREWLESEREENEKCLVEMRKYLPQNVAKMSKADIQQYALDEAKKYKPKKGEDVSLLGVYPSDLAIYFKECSFLHWLVMHQSDIRKSNFLIGDSSQHFQNLEKYDIVELRAVAAVLPDNFEFDSEGRKADWRATFLARLKTLTQQQERAKV
jgi:hypothetical protein